MRAVLYRTRVACVVAGIALPLVLSGQSQDAVDARFRASIDPANIRENMQRLSARPHHVGSPYDKDNAEWMLARFKEWGWDARDRDLRRAVPDAEGAAARDDRADALQGDARRAAGRRSIPPRGRSDEQLPTYNAYSIDGDVTAPLVYVNYGRPEDYEELDAPRRLGEGRDRHRALRRVVARHQAEGRGRARRGRLPDLLRSARRRLFAERRCFRTARCGTRTACSGAA